MKTIALVGCGRISGRHIQVLTQTPGIRLVGVCDVIEERARKAAEPNALPFYTDAMEMLAAASPDAFGEVYGVLLADKRARGNAPEAPSPDDGWSPLRCIFCLSEMPNHTAGCTVGTPEKMAAYKAARRL